ncbi:unnamed protein product, partial [Allacma fusca]
ITSVLSLSLSAVNVPWIRRFRDTSSSPDASSKRYVITNPPDDFTMLPTDQVRPVVDVVMFLL